VSKFIFSTFIGLKLSTKHWVGINVGERQWKQVRYGHGSWHGSKFKHTYKSELEVCENTKEKTQHL
jgi:hypothetical protein